MIKKPRNLSQQIMESPLIKICDFFFNAKKKKRKEKKRKEE